MGKSLANCFTLAKMWDGHAGGSSELVQNTILDEVRRLFLQVIASLSFPIFTTIMRFHQIRMH